MTDKISLETLRAQWLEVVGSAEAMVSAMTAFAALMRTDEPQSGDVDPDVEAEVAAQIARGEPVL